MVANIDYCRFADRFWLWRGYQIGYCVDGCPSTQYSGAAQSQPAVLLIHGFGASVGHWRKNIPVLAQMGRVYAIDLVGFGSSAQPHPSELPYTFET